MATADMKNRRAAMLRPGGFVVVAVGRSMCEVSLGHEMNRALDNLSSTRHHSQDQEEGD